MNALWPEAGEVDLSLIKEAEYLTFVSHEFRIRLRKMMDMKGKVSSIHVMIAHTLWLKCSRTKMID